MPELPDLQVFARNLNKLVKCKKIVELNLKNRKTSKSSVKELRKAIKGKTIKNVYREGKQVHIAFSKNLVLGMHLMLHGGLHVITAGDKLGNVVFEMSLSNRKQLVRTDWQAAANVQLNPEIPASPDALSTRLTLKYLKQKLTSRAAIKNVILDQKIMRGIGNAYADEILWDAGIAPFSAAGKIPAEKVKRLLLSIKRVLKGAEKQILKSHPDIIQGEVRDFLKIHNSKKKESPTGNKILTATRGGRKTYYTREQELYT